MKTFKSILLLLVLFATSLVSKGHPMPHSILELSIGSQTVSAELRIPLKEMQFAVPFDVTEKTDVLFTEHGNEIEAYLLEHFHIKSVDGQQWSIQFSTMQLDSTEQEATGKYLELAIDFLLTPPSTTTTRKFTLFYDAVVHQLVTHKIFVTIKNDFATGRIDSSPIQLGVISANPANNVVEPMPINLENGSAWTGFVQMITLGIHHISEGTDHLLFLLMLLLPSSLLAFQNRWTTFRGTKQSAVHVFKIVTAFTIGHSLSLMIGAFEWLVLPTKPVEVGIAVTIFITGIHAFRPLFPNKEIIVASAFGIVHGLAFSSVLTELNLHGSDFAIALLGFNIGIELMQVFLIIATLPWLIMLSPYSLYKIIRITLAALTMLASIGWALERIFEKKNAISIYTDQLSIFLPFLLAFLALTAIAVSFFSPKKTG
jgi:HupE / UreJ protein